MEIERKFKIRNLPEGLDQYAFHTIEQAYLCINPVVRIRRQDNQYILTYKSTGLMAREEYNLPLNEEAYAHLKAKADGVILSKTRYLIPLSGNLTAELDIFDKPYERLVIAEVEFSSLDEANAFTPPEWFGEDVTGSGQYHNSTLSRIQP